MAIMDRSIRDICTIYILLQIGFASAQILTQADLDNIAANLEINVDVVENLNDGSQHIFKVYMKNKGSVALSGTNWKIYFYSFFIVEPKHIISDDGLYTKPEGYILQDSNLKLMHENGILFSMSPTPAFLALAPNTKREIAFNAANWAVSKTDIPPNWYLDVKGLSPRVIESTKRYFVGEFIKSKQWKRSAADYYNPFSPKQRYQRYQTESTNIEPKLVIPTPKSIQRYSTTDKLNMTGDVTIVHGGLANEAQYLKGKTGFPISNTAVSGNINIYLKLNNSIVDEEGYTLEVDSDIWIIGKTASAVFYGIQTLLSMLASESLLPKLKIVDEPRFKYRGMHVDLARNFIKLDTLYNLVEAMASYKLNKLHLHLTDDEGWRIEINGLPELTEIASKRCQSEELGVCLIPQLGSGPDTTTSGSGYLSIKNYTDLLSYAKARHIEIIPEIDMPGHARAAIMAMEGRYRKLNKTGQVLEAEKYRLIDPQDDSKYLSVQNFDDNALNPCVVSTYTFIEKIVSEIKSMHDSVRHPLKIFHFGGDEVAKTAWVNSTVCQSLNLKGDASQRKTSLKKIFTEKVSNITSAYGLNMAGWEDGFTFANGMPFERHIYNNTEVISNAWDNVWEWGEARRAYNFANKGYKVIMSHATHLYFDHPYEPDPDERGLYWATRFTDSLKTFGFLPDSLYSNIDVSRMGATLDRDEICGENNKNCPVLQKPENILGIQGHLWSETVLNEEIFYYMVFPRLLALAERAWHKASWENEENKSQRDVLMKADWAAFSHALGKKELKRLDDMGITYRVPPPGASVEGDEIKTGSAFPGLVVEHSTDNTNSWKTGTIINKEQDIFLRTKSADGKRSSRIIRMSFPRSETTSGFTLQITSTYLMVGSLLVIAFLNF